MNINFYNKEQFFTIIESWKSFINGGRAKPARNGTTADTPLPSQYHLLYSLLRNKGYIGFVPESQGLEKAKSCLRHMKVSDAQKVFGEQMTESILFAIQSQI